MYDTIQEQIAAYEREIRRKQRQMEPEEHGRQMAPPLLNANRGRLVKQLGQETKRQALYRMSGVDATQIDAIGVAIHRPRHPGATGG